MPDDLCLAVALFHVMAHCIVNLCNALLVEHLCYQCERFFLRFDLYDAQ